MAFDLPKLPYGYDALEPHYDAQTVEIHHSKHHNAYTTNLNLAVEAAGWGDKSIEDILANLSSAPADQQKALTNHGGGYHNHKLFFEGLAAKGGNPEGELADAIGDTFGGFEGFQEKFTAAAAKHFGSGWAWLAMNKEGGLEVIDTHDQVSPITLGYTPLMTVDVWEHAYYLKYKNVRPDWIKAWWNIVSWGVVAERYADAKK